MNKKIIIIAAAILIVGAVTYGLLREPSTSTSSAPRSQSAPSANDELSNDQNQIVANPGVYRDYDQSAFDSTPGKKVLFFHAPWCLQCRSIEQGMTPDAIPSEVTIFKVDYDSRQDLRQKYEVRLQTTFVVINERGEVEETYVAYDDPYFDSVRRAIFES